MHEPPKRALQRLLYVSRARDDTLQNMAAVFPQILSVSQSINAKREITGCLLACNGWFMQILEGPGVGVQVTYASIQRDPRHHEVQIKSVGPIDTRGFPHWSMCGRVLSPADAEIVAVLETGAGFDAMRLPPDRATHLLKRIQDVQGRHGEDPFLLD